MKKEQYKRTVDLLLKILPFALNDHRVALKGGTAINLFHRDFLRTSIDIDLCYLPLENRAITFKNLHEILVAIKSALETNLNLNVVSNVPLDGKKEAKLIARGNGVEVKIEPNFVLRSSLFPVNKVDLSNKAQTEFKKFVSVQCLSFADVYGSKICAALDRQHPRDLFDVKYLLENEGITPELKDSFIFYLISHNRPIDELLRPNLKEICSEYQDEFLGMVQVEIDLDELVACRKKLIDEINNSLTNTDKDFLISFVLNKPDWTKVCDGKIKDYPAVKWKLMNQEKMSKDKHKKYVEKVKNILERS